MEAVGPPWRQRRHSGVRVGGRREAGTGCGGWRGREAAEAAGPRGAVGREASWFLFSVAESRGKGEPRSGSDPGILLKWVGGSDVSGARALVTSIPRLK